MTESHLPGSPVLELEGLVSGYGGSRVVDGVHLRVGRGECLVLLGRNGVGKSTLINTLIGWVKPLAGRVVLNGNDITGARPERIARAGIGLVPQGRRVMAGLTVRENLVIAERRRGPDSWTVEDAFAFFPRLQERANNLGRQLSGGEQQMVAIARALVGNPELLLLDEPSDGLAPSIVEQIIDSLHQLTARGMTVVLVEQGLAPAFALATRVAVMEKGRLVLDVGVEEFRADSRRARSLLGIGNY